MDKPTRFQPPLSKYIKLKSSKNEDKMEIFFGFKCFLKCMSAKLVFVCNKLREFWNWNWRRFAVFVGIYFYLQHSFDFSKARNIRLPKSVTRGQMSWTPFSILCATSLFLGHILTAKWPLALDLMVSFKWLNDVDIF